MEGVRFSYEESLLTPMMQYVPYFRTLSSRAYMPVWERLAKTDSLPITQYGIGKSTLFRLLAGMEEAREGTVLIGDRHPEELGQGKEHLLPLPLGHLAYLPLPEQSAVCPQPFRVPAQPLPVQPLCWAVFSPWMPGCRQSPSPQASMAL